MDLPYVNKEGSSSSSYYTILGVRADSSDDEIRRAYRKLAMQWHPDKWTRNPSLLGEAKRKFQLIQEAYSVLSDRSKRTMYDAGLYDPSEEEEEGFSDFLQEMMSLMEDVRKEEKHCSLEELRSMFWEMAQGFEFPEWPNSSQQPIHESPQWFYAEQVTLDDTQNRKRRRADTDYVCQRSSRTNMSGLEIYGTSQLFR